MVTVSDFINYLAKVKDKSVYLRNAVCGYKITSVLVQDGAVYIYITSYDKPLSIRNLIDILITIDKPNYVVKLVNGNIKFILERNITVFIGAFNLLSDYGGTFIFRDYRNI